MLVVVEILTSVNLWLFKLLKNMVLFLIDVDEVPDDELVVPSAMMGAPTVLVEKILMVKSLSKAFAFENHMGKIFLALFQ